jgi:hypothetical protein
MAKEAHAGPLKSGFATRLDIPAGERDKTLCGFNPQKRDGTDANGLEQFYQRNAWHEDSHG